ncbi:MAG: SMR family transporter [Planctomycetota bacterium]|nr:SMR family transporter [Planctomycetota bacterium]
MNVYIFMLLTIILNSVANILIKVSSTRIDKAQGILGINMLNLYFIGGVFSFALALFAYSQVLSKMKLGIAYPVITSACFIIVLFTSWLYLKESISLVQLVGILLILGGIWLVLK